MTVGGFARPSPMAPTSFPNASLNVTAHVAGVFAALADRPHSTTLALELGAPGATVMDAPSFRAATHPSSSHDVPSEDFGQTSAATA